MRCRVVGLDVEGRMLAHGFDRLKQAGAVQVSARFVATGKNAPEHPCATWPPVRAKK